MKKWWSEKRYDIKDAAITIACGLGMAIVYNSVLLWRIKRIVKK
jgi:hypothetical protein